MTEKVPLLDIVIVNWNAGRLLNDCLDSIEISKKDNFELSRVVVLDNASQDGSVDNLHDLDFLLLVFRNKVNRGFAAACNQGAKGSRADYLLFLNPDTRLFSNSLAKPLAFMEHLDNSKVGILGIQLLDGNGRVSCSCARFPSPRHFLSQMLGLDRVFPHLFPSHFMSEWDHQESRKVDHVMGAFFLIRRSVFEELGGFDESFFVYLEDLDFSYRSHKAEWSSYYLAEAQVFHKGGGTSEKIKAIRLFYSLLSRIIYGYKHFNWFAATALMLGTLLVEPFSRLAWAFARCSSKEMLETLKGYCMLWGALPTLLKVTSKYGNA